MIYPPAHKYAVSFYKFSNIFNLIWHEVSFLAFMVKFTTKRQFLWIGRHHAKLDGGGGLLPSGTLR